MEGGKMTDTIITTGGKERIEETASLLSKAFETDPVITYLLAPMGSSTARLAYLPAYFKVLLSAASLNEGVFIKADGFKSVSVLMPPGRRVDNVWTLQRAGFIGMLRRVGVQSCYRMLFEFTPMTDACKLAALKSPTQKYYYVFFTATASAHQGRGLYSASMRHLQSVASRDRLPLWLEATTEKSMRVYEKVGFEIVDVMVLGKGVADENGNPKVGGGGMKIWGMVWWPDGLGDGAADESSERKGLKRK